MTKSILLATCDRQLEIDLITYFQQDAFTIQTIRRGHKVVLEILENDYDFLIVDHFLDGLSGEELIQIVRRSRPQIPIIYIAEEDDFEKSKHIMEEGILLRLFKPFDPYEYTFLRDLINFKDNNFN